MRKRKITFRHRIEYLFFIAFVFLIKISPLFMVKFNKKMLRFLFGKFSKRHPGVVARNLEIAFPAAAPEERAALTERIYRHFSTVLIDIIYIFVKKRPEKILKPIRIVHLEYLEQALEKQRGVILFSAHFGNWELVPYILSRALNVKLNSIARKMDNPLVEKKVLQFREFMGSLVIDKKNAVRTMLKRLEKNGIVYLLIDQNTIEREAVFVEFFGQMASAVPSVPRLHLKKEIPVIPLFLHYEEDEIVLELQEELDAAGICNNLDRENNKADIKECVRRMTQYCTTVIEEQVRQYPEQWFWFHNRWKTKPPKKHQKQESNPIKQSNSHRRKEE
jgi:KDO2-lipid IV(A) lauroyltransferase